MIKVCAVKSNRSAISWPDGTERVPSVLLAQARSEVSSVVPGVPAAKPSWANEAMPLSLRACTTSSTSAAVKLGLAIKQAHGNYEMMI